MIRAAYESSNFWYRELVDIPKYPITENSYGFNRDSGLSVPPPSLHASDTTASLDGAETVERNRHRERLSHAVVRGFRHGADAIKRIALFWRDQGDRNGKLPTGPSFSKSMQVPVREREVLRDDRTPPDAVSVSSSPSELISCRTGCPPTTACIVHRPAKRHTFESTECDGDWPKLAGSDLTSSTTSKPDPEIRILTRMFSAMRLSAVFASGAIALPAILIFGLVLLGSSTAWAQSTVTYRICVYDTWIEDNDRINLTVGPNQIFTDHVLTKAESCKDVTVGVRIPTDLTITALNTGDSGDNTAAVVIRNAQSGRELERGSWDLDTRESESWTIWAISEDELLLSEPDDPPEFVMDSNL